MLNRSNTELKQLLGLNLVLILVYQLSLPGIKFSHHSNATTYKSKT